MAAPYDRILATAGVRHVPAPWLAQVRASGVIVAPWGTGYSQQDAIVRLITTGDGTASGRFTGGAGFMKLRAQRNRFPDHEDYLPGGAWPKDLRESHTTLRLEDLPGFVKELKSQPVSESLKPKPRYVPDWRRNHSGGFLPGWLVVFVTLLGCEWGLRRLWGLV